METTAPATTTEAPVSGQSTDKMGENNPNLAIDKEAAQEKRKFKAKVNGREVDVDEDTLLRDFQKYQSADERFRAASEKEKKYGKYEEFEKALQNKDLSILSKYVDPDTIRQFSEKQLLEWLEYQGLSDEQKELLETKNRLKEYEDEKTSKQKEYEEQQRLQVNQQAIQLLDKEIADTFTEIGQKPTPAIIMRMAMHMQAALSQKEPQFMSGKEAYRRASKDLSTDLTGYLESIPEKDIASILPKRVIDAIRKQSVENAQAPFARNKTQETQEYKSTGKIRSTTDDFFKQLDQKYQRR
jgi:hypothetical protein